MMPLAEWSERTLGDIGETLIGLTYSPSQVNTNGDLVLRSSNIQNGVLDLKDTVRVSANIPAKIRVKESDVLICVRNGSRSLIGKSLLLDHRVEGETFGAFMAVYRSPLNEYLGFFFQSNDFKRQVDSHLGATINQITNRSLKSFRVLIPPASDRLKIARALADISRLVHQIGALISKKQAIKQGMVQQLLTGKTRLPGFSEAWTDGHLVDVVKVRHGRNQREVETPTGQFPILGTGGVIGWTDTPLYSRPSVLIGRKGTIDRPQFRDTPFWTVDTLFYTEVSPFADPRFLYYFFTTVDWRSMNEASGVPSLNSSRIESVRIQIPPLDEQNAIGSVLRDFELQIEALEEKLFKFQALKSGMMQELLSGRTRLMPAGEKV